MSAAEKRRSARVACHFLAEVDGPADWPPLTVLDVSREGVLLGVCTRGVDLERPSSLGELAARLRGAMQGSLTVRLHPDRLGNLVSRELRIVRMAPPARRGFLAELGCRFDRPLWPEEAAALGVDLASARAPGRPRATEPTPPPVAPPVPEGREAHAAPPGGGSRPGHADETVSPAPTPTPTPTPAPSAPVSSLPPLPPARAPVPAGRRLPAHHRASLIPRRRGVDAPLRGRPESLDAQGGLLVVTAPAPSRWAGSRGAASLFDRVVALETRYGSEVDLVLEDEAARYLFFGPVDVTSVEAVDDAGDQLLVGFAFQRSLLPQELVDLGIEMVSADA